MLIYPNKITTAAIKPTTSTPEGEGEGEGYPSRLTWFLSIDWLELIREG